MKERIVRELALLRQHYPNLVYREEGRWILIPEYPLPDGWGRSATDVAFPIPVEFPGGPPYGIYVPSGMKFNGQPPENYQDTAPMQPPFGGTWGIFSWTTVDGKWRATAQVEPAGGYTLLAWVTNFAIRFADGR